MVFRIALFILVAGHGDYIRHTCAQGMKGQSFQWLVGRSTDDGDLDLVRALVQRQRFDDALAICLGKSQEFPTTSDPAAKWSIEYSRVLTAQQLNQEVFDEEEVNLAIRPISKILEAYPNHDRRFFLLAQIYQTRKDAALHLISRSVVLPSNALLRDHATRFTLNVTQEIEKLQSSIGEQRTLLNSENTERSRQLLGELQRLQQELVVAIVSLSLLQTDLLTPGSDDFIGAASRSEKLAVEASGILPTGTKARREIERLRLEALLRMEQYAKAESIFKLLRLSIAEQETGKWTAFRVRLHLEQKRTNVAQKELESFYRRPITEVLASSTNQSRLSLETDLALLRFFLSRTSSQDVANCLRWIERRNGPYARRRADALALDVFRDAEDGDSMNQSPQLIAARGQEYIREGSLRTGAELLAAAAVMKGPDDQALLYAAQSAASFLKIGSNELAHGVLARASIAHPNVKTAAAMHLQSAVIQAESDPQSVDEIESRLVENLRTWPTSETSNRARLWLKKIMTADHRLLDVARLMTDLQSNQLTPKSVEAMAIAWREVFRDESLVGSEVSEQFLSSFREIADEPSVQKVYTKLALLLLNAKQLNQLDTSSVKFKAGDFENAVLRTRRDHVRVTGLESPPAGWLNDFWIQDLVVCLLKDAQKHSTIRKFVAGEILSWNDVELTPRQRARCLLWTEEFSQALAAIDQWIEMGINDAGRIESAATLLSASDNQLANDKAAILWDQLASGMQRGGSKWHQAKIARIAALRAAGKLDESARLAKYLLLTAPGLNPVLRQAYEEASK